MKTVAVFFGGQSVEHDISIITGVLTLNSIDKEKYIPFPVYIDKSGAWFTGECLFDLDNYKNLNLKKLVRVTMVAGDNSIYSLKKNAVKNGVDCGGDKLFARRARGRRQFSWTIKYVWRAVSVTFACTVSRVYG